MGTNTRSLHRLLSVLLTVAMLLSCSSLTAFAANDDGTREAIHLGVPAEISDGVYYAEVNMKNASNPIKQYSMGNAALRGSVSYKSKQPTDTEYRPIVIVKDGKATALLEFMPMGYIGMYGFMMELEGVYPASFTRYGSPNASDPDTVFTETQTLTYQKTADGKIVYDGYNDPDSDYKFDGSELRPAGFGKPEEYLDIVNKYYTHLLALDVTPVMIKTDDDEVPTAAADYNGEHAAFCHVFVPVMFDISPTSGDQYARMEVNWKTLEQIDDPENNVQYMLYEASKTSTDGYSAASVAAFESAYKEVRESLENVWAKQRLELSGSGFAAQPVLDLKTYTAEEQTAMAQKLKAAIDGLTIINKDALGEKLDEAKAVDATAYTADSYRVLSDAIEAAERVYTDDNATQEDVDAKVALLQSAIDGLKSASSADGWDGVTVKEPQGSGESVNITSAEELAWLAQQVNSGVTFACVFLENDIDLNAKAWTPIGTKANPFTGEFYGNGHTVSGLAVKGSDNYQGLFGYVCGEENEKAAVVDLAVEGAIKTTATNVGGVIGSALYARLENLNGNVRITIDRVNNNDYVAVAGGVVGEALYCDIAHCFNDADITAVLQEKVGGIAGYASGSYIRNSGNIGNITAGGATGGIVGNYFVRSGTRGVISCYNKGSVNGNGAFVGGIIGTATSTGSDAQGVYGNLYNRGDVTAQHTVGGIIGGYSGGDLSMMSACYSTGSITATVNSSDSAGALVGRLYSGTIFYSYAEEGSFEKLYTKGISGATQLVSNCDFKSAEWFKGDDFFTALGSAASSYDKDPGTLNDGYPVLAFETEDILNGVKADALAELIAYKNANDYKGLAKNAIEKIKTDAADAINAAENEEAVKTALSDAKAALDAVPNDPNYGLDLSVIREKLSTAKELEAKGGELYTEKSWNSFTATIAGIDYLIENGFGTQEKVEEYITYLDENTAALEYRDADYSAVEAAIAAIPSDLSQYTDETVAAVEAAKDAVVRDKKITEQSEVDAMAKAINDAVANLEKKKDDDSLDFTQLPDGVYSINFTMVKMNRTDLSMSNDAVNHTAKLTVKDGNYTLTVNFKGLHYLNRFGYLAKLSYYDDGYTYGEYGAVIGELMTATVLSVQKNADGSDVTDEFNVPGGSAEGMKYPESISFPIVNTAKADAEGFIPLHVFVPVMEDISAGSGDQDVLMKLDFATLAKSTDDDPSFIPDKPEELSPAVDYIDSMTGVRVSADKGVLPEGVQVIVTEITSGSDYDNAVSALSTIGKNFKLYDVRFVDADGNEVSPNGTVTVIFPVPADYNSAAAAVYRISDNGAKTLIKGTIDGSSYSVITKSTGKYAIVEKDSDVNNAADNNGGSNTNGNGNSNGNNNNGSTNNGTKAPQTGDASVLLLAIMLTVTMAALPVLATGEKKRRNSEGE